MLGKSLNQFSVDGWGCVPCLLFGLRPNYGRGNGSNGDQASLVAQRLKHLPPMRETLGSILGSGRSPGEGNGNPLQYSCLENPMDGEAW